VGACLGVEVTTRECVGDADVWRIVPEDGIQTVDHLATLTCRHGCPFSPRKRGLCGSYGAIDIVHRCSRSFGPDDFGGWIQGFNDSTVGCSAPFSVNVMTVFFDRSTHGGYG